MIYFWATMGITKFIERIYMYPRAQKYWKGWNGQSSQCQTLCHMEQALNYMHNGNTKVIATLVTSLTTRPWEHQYGQHAVWSYTTTMRLCMVWVFNLLHHSPQDDWWVYTILSQLEYQSYWSTIWSDDEWWQMTDNFSCHRSSDDEWWTFSLSLDI